MYRVCYYHGNDEANETVMAERKERINEGSKLLRLHCDPRQEDNVWAAGLLFLAMTGRVEFPDRDGGRGIIRFENIDRETS